MKIQTYYKKFKNSVTPNILIQNGFAKGWTSGEYRLYKDGLVAETDLNGDRSIHVKDSEWWYPNEPVKNTVFEILEKLDYLME